MNPSSNLFLIGPMGAGKSTVGQRLARSLGMLFIDLDARIEEQAGAAVTLIFEHEGEAGFRTRERAMLERLCSGNGLVLATGGGCILDPANRDTLRRHGFVLYLQATVELQLLRLSRDRTRPLLRAPDRAQRLRQLAELRDPLYREIADLCIAAERHGPAVMAQRALTALRAHWQPLPPAHFPDEADGP